MNQSSVRLVLANRSSVGLSYLLCPFFLLLSICSHCRSHLGLILKILFVPGRTIFPFAFLPLLTSFSFLSFFRSFLSLLSSFLCFYHLLGPFPYFCDSLFALKRPVSRALFGFHISSRKLIRVSRFFLLCAPSIIFMTLSFTHEIHQVIREFLFPPCPVWVSNSFPMFARSIAFPNSLIFASFAFSVLLEFFPRWSHLTYASPNFFSPPFVCSCENSEIFRFFLLLVDLLWKPLFCESVS